MNELVTQQMVFECLGFKENDEGLLVSYAGTFAGQTLYSTQFFEGKFRWYAVPPEFFVYAQRALIVGFVYG